jgi:hypothetical protein
VFAMVKTPRFANESAGFLIRRLRVRVTPRPPSFLETTQVIARAKLASDATVASIGSIFLLLIAVALFCSTAFAGELPDSPHLKMRGPMETYAPDQRMLVHNVPNRVVLAEPPRKILDWQFVTVHAIYAASNAFDHYVTARGLGQPCGFVEGNTDLGSNPSPKSLAVHGAVEFAAVVAGDAFVKWMGRRNKVPHWFNEFNGSIAATIGTVKHIHGGMAWVNTGCL